MSSPIFIEVVFCWATNVEFDWICVLYWGCGRGEWYGVVGYAL